MFKLSNLFIKQEEAESATAGGGETAENSDGQTTVLTEGQDNTETKGNEETDVNESDKQDSESDDNTNDSEDNSEDDKGENEVPEKYEFEVPEGMELDEALAEKFTGVAKELGLNNDQANQLIGMYVEQMQNFQEEYSKQWDTQVSTWADELKADPDFGGSNFDKNSEIARIAVNKFGGDELKKALNDTGLGNHPAVVKFMHQVGLAISEDSFGTEENNKGGQKESTPQGLYSKSNMNP